MRTLAALTAILVAAAAPAQQLPVKPVDEIIADLALGHCPMVLAGQFPLRDNSTLTAMGFPRAPADETSPSMGAIQTLFRPHPDGNIRFAVRPGRICQVVADGSRRAAALARIRRSLPMMAEMGTNFRPAPRPANAPATASVEAFKATVAPGQVLNLHLVELATPQPTLIAQMFVTAN
jgi:hypothetical protein